MEIVLESYRIVPERRLMIYLLIELININIFIYLLEINRAKKYSMRILLMGQFCSPSRQTTKETKGKGKEKKKKKNGGGPAGWADRILI
jgi:hypothetical protein